MPNPDLLISEFVSKAGNVRVTIDLSNPTEPNDFFNIFDFGTIDYDFDVTSYGDVVNNIGAMYSRTKLTCSVYTKANRNLLDLLYPYLFSGTYILPVTVNVDTFTGDSYEFVYEIRPNGLKYDENSLKLTIDLDPPLKPTETVSGVFASITNKFLVGTSLGTAVSGVMVGSFIDKMVGNLNTNLTTIYEPASTTSGYSDLTYAKPIFGVPPVGIQLWSTGASASGLAIEELSRFAVLGGDIYGTGFGSNFYVNRANLNRVVQVDYDELEALQYSFTPSPYQTITLTMDGTSPSNVLDTSVTSSGNRFAEKSISGLYTLPNYINKAKWTALGTFADTDYTGYLSRDIEPIITGSGVDAHKRALNAQAIPLVRVEFVVFGMHKIKPYEAIEFIGDVPDRYKYTTGTNPRYFRPTSLSYDLFDDKVKVKAYSIS